MVRIPEWAYMYNFLGSLLMCYDRTVLSCHALGGATDIADVRHDSPHVPWEYCTLNFSQSEPI